MPYIDAEQVRTIRNALKAKLPNVKFSIRKQHCSSVSITVLKSNVHFDTNHSVNPYHFENHDYTEYQKIFIKDILDTVQKAHPKKIISEDGDYGSIPNYYLNLSIRQIVRA